MRDLHRLFEKPHSWWRNEACHQKLLRVLRGASREVYKDATFAKVYGASPAVIFDAVWRTR